MDFQDPADLRMKGRYFHRPTAGSLLAALFAALAFFSPLSAISSGGSTQDALQCGTAFITVTTSCSDTSYPGAPICQKQTLTFSNRETGKTRTIDAAGEGVKNDGGELILDGLAAAWGCVEASGGRYVVVRYNNGGNCDACEWDEIYTVKGERLTKNTRTNKAKFDNVARQLGVKGYSDQLADIRWPGGR